jgi:hypothetical protein
MQSLKQTRHNLETKTDLQTLVGAIEQFIFFEDQGTSFERSAARRYLADKLLAVKRNAATREAESQDDSNT